MANNNKDYYKLKESLAEATASVRDKFRQLRSSKVEENRLLEEQYKPITGKLGKLIESVSVPKKTKTKKGKINKKAPIARSTPRRSLVWSSDDGGDADGGGRKHGH